MKLADVQELVADAVRRDEPLARDPAMADRAAAIARGNDRLSPAEQLDVYREQFFLRHASSLREDFPTLVHLLGDDGFDAMARAYLRERPSTAFSLRDLAADVATFLASVAPWSADALLADCARAEWAFIESYDAPDAPAFDPRTLAEAPEDAWPTAVLAFHPSVRLLALAHPAHDFRRAVRAGEKPDRPAPSAARVVVFRPGERGETVHYADVDPLAFDLLTALARGEPLGAACEELGDAIEPHLGAWFQQWTTWGLLARVTFS